AQANGFAETDPTLDVGGFDTAHKLAILACLAYGTGMNFKDIYTEGISRITPLDIEYSSQFGYKIKLLAISKDHGDAIEARVHPTMIPFDNLLSNVNGSLNAITISGDAVGDILLYGHGAGMMPTASAVISDTVDISRNILSGVNSRIPLLAYQMDHIRHILDQPGVLSKIAGILGNYGISIKTVHQKGRKTSGSVPIVMLTHLSKEADVRKALAEITALDIVGDAPVLIRIEDEDG
ncbi:MAG: homoserine dehydrogenase, partial [Deltaproteobacteria bacterium]|nr:homoserine dehydrogenase [Deltaproteobacteria bacterium]